MNAKGLQVKTLSEIVSDLESSLRQVYGDDINLGQNTPDGQMLRIYAQSAVDMRELLQQINNNFDPEQAQGIMLDQRVAINGLKRKGASFTYIAVEVTINKGVSLTGLDDQSQEVVPDIPNLYTVKDDAGVAFYLLKSTTITGPQPQVTEDTSTDTETEPITDSSFAALKATTQQEYTAEWVEYSKQITELYKEQGAWVGQYDRPDIPQRPAILDIKDVEQYVESETTTAGDSNQELEPVTVTLEFRAKDIGRVETLVGTVRTPVTVINGVIGLDNPTQITDTNLGRDEETDAQLKVRRRLSVAPSAIGYLDALQGNLLSIDGVDLVRVHENNTNETDPETGILPHTIWVIVQDGGDEEIAKKITDVLYRTKTAGVGMRGEQTVEIPRDRGLPFIARYDRPKDRDLHVQFTANVIQKSGGRNVEINESLKEQLKEQIVKTLIWDIGQRAGSDDVVQIVKELYPEFRVSKVVLAESEDKLSEEAEVLPLTLDERWKLNKARITINDA